MAVAEGIEAMEVVGGGTVHVYPPVDEGSHTPGPQEQWQESVVLLWYDLKNSIGGFYRIGHEMNYPGGPMVVLWSTTFTPEGVFKRNSFLPLRPQDRTSTRLASGDDACSYEFDGNCVWKISEEGLSGQLRVHDFHASIDCYPKKGAISEFAPHHMEVAGRVTGKLKVGEKTYDVDALSFRDHGWGVRAWEAILSHRWVSGVIGPEFSFCFLAWHAIDDSLAQFGWVVRGNQVTYAKKLDFVAYMDADAITSRGGHVTATLTTGEVIELEFEPLTRGSVSTHHGVVCSDILTKFHYGGKVGIADFETSGNPQKGGRIPVNLAKGVIADGWHPSA